MIKDPEAVGIRTDSAINPICSISGMTSLKALAAPVVVKMILFMMLLVLRRSVLPSFGSLSSTAWDPVAAWTVAMDADRMRLGPNAFNNGFTMCAKQVVVQDAFDISRCFLGS